MKVAWPTEHGSAGWSALRTIVFCVEPQHGPARTVDQRGGHDAGNSQSAVGRDRRAAPKHSQRMAFARPAAPSDPASFATATSWRAGTRCAPRSPLRRNETQHRWSRRTICYDNAAVRTPRCRRPPFSSIVVPARGLGDCVEAGPGMVPHPTRDVLLVFCVAFAAPFALLAPFQHIIIRIRLPLLIGQSNGRRRPFNSADHARR